MDWHLQINDARLRAGLANRPLVLLSDIDAPDHDFIAIGIAACASITPIHIPGQYNSLYFPSRANLRATNNLNPIAFFNLLHCLLPCPKALQEPGKLFG